MLNVIPGASTAFANIARTLKPWRGLKRGLRSCNFPLLRIYHLFHGFLWLKIVG